MSSYPNLRRCGITAADAYRVSKHAPSGGRVPLANGVGDVVIDGVRVHVLMVNDPGAWDRIGSVIYGSFCDRWYPGALSNCRWSSAPAAWFIPATNYRTLRNELHAEKLGRSHADALARRLIAHAQERALAYGHEWRYVRLIAQVVHQGRVCLQLETDGVEFEPGRERPAAIHRIAWTLACQAAETARGNRRKRANTDAYH